MTTQELAARVRAALTGTGDVREVRMFGGIGFTLNGNLVVAASSRGLLLRVGKDRQREALAQPGARAMEMRGRVMEGYVQVDPAELAEGTLRRRLQPALAFVQSLPPKQAGSDRSRTKGNRK